MKGGPRQNKTAPIRALHGSQTRDRHQHLTESPPVAEMPPPAGLSPLEADCWRYYASRLAAIRVLSELDKDTLRAFCAAAAAIQEIRQLQQAPGYQRVVKMRSHPL